MLERLERIWNLIAGGSKGTSKAWTRLKYILYKKLTFENLTPYFKNQSELIFSQAKRELYITIL